MPPRKRGRKVKRAAPPSAGRPSLDALPDEVLHHMLSFLPAQEAVRTCVLARRWRHLWKSATGLRILCGNGHEAASVSELREFVYHLLLLRGGSPLDTCVLDLCGYEDEDIPLMRLWIRHVLMCKVQALSLDIGRFTIPGDPCLEVGNLPLVSQNLKRLKLESQQVNDSFLDFSRCPALEVLKFDDCEFLDCHRISSQSLKFLSFSNCDFDTEFCTYIYAPNLISLWLEVTEGWTPLLERMPSLVEAVVKIKFSDDSYCGRCGDEDCSSRYTVHGDSVDTVLLQGLSEAQSLVLMSDIRVCVFRRDLKCCPMFSNLKTLTQ
ncbi:unnamed protein product [Miscanthus lutarioriparius]|uniref:F-box domain-containing protein n=1 Tax=Miscanthus lutarioriparius TaxID=422564 RepID=A0A811Q9B2_9POAL|nr:unnamed protein product [Miscanthus lutarioriparius]